MSARLMLPALELAGVTVFLGLPRFFFAIGLGAAGTDV
jgi:hypothetical protein